MSGGFPLAVIPVIDLQGGQVVHAVAGDRAQYRPLRSPVADSANPLAVATGLAARVGHHDLYVADLDAIAGRDAAWGHYEQLLEGGFSLWLDAGTGDKASVQTLADFRVGGRQLRYVIVGSETLADADRLRSMIADVGTDRLVFSLDLDAGRPRTVAPRWNGKSPLEIVEDVVAQGVERLILLELRQVGTSAGVCYTPLLRQIRRRWPQLMLVAGGGVGSHLDLVRLAEAGCDAALVASWLHRCEAVKKSGGADL